MSVKQGLKAKQMHPKLNMRFSWEVFYDWKMEIRDWKRMQSHNYTSFPPQNFVPFLLPNPVVSGFKFTFIQRKWYIRLSARQMKHTNSCSIFEGNDVSFYLGDKWFVVLGYILFVL